MIRGLIVLLVLVVLAFVGAWLADNPGAVHVVWRQYRLDTSVGVLVLAVTIATAIIIALYRFIVVVVTLPQRLARARCEHRRKRGYLALARGLVAVAAGDGAVALQEARRAAALLDEPTLTLLLQAQAAQAAGDLAGARQAFLRMLDGEDTRLLGLRGLTAEAMKNGDDGAALQYIEQARALEPRAAWALEALFDLQIRAGKWTEAETTLDAALKARIVTPEEGRHRRAVLRLEQSRQAEANGLEEAALDHARAAERLDEDFLPAILRAADLLARRGRRARAARLLERAWEKTPHRLIAEGYAALYPEETPLERVIRIEKLRALHPDRAETHMVLGRAALKAGLWGEARTHLKAACDMAPSRAVFMALAELAEVGDNDSAAARRWLQRAAEAPLDPAWVCGGCGRESAHYQALCPACGAFDSYRYGPRAPGERPRIAGGTRVMPASLLPASGS